MAVTCGRRAILAGTSAVFAAASARAAAPQRANAQMANAQIAAIEQRNGGRLGVAVLDTGSGLSITYRSTERFPMCSTFKSPAAVLNEAHAHIARIITQAF
jgi:beta-lactamase class A